MEEEYKKDLSFEFNALISSSIVFIGIFLSKLINPNPLYNMTMSVLIVAASMIILYKTFGMPELKIEEKIMIFLIIIIEVFLVNYSLKLSIDDFIMSIVGVLLLYLISFSFVFMKIILNYLLNRINPIITLIVLVSIFAFIIFLIYLMFKFSFIRIIFLTIILAFKYFIMSEEDKNEEKELN